MPVPQSASSEELLFSVYEVGMGEYDEPSDYNSQEETNEDNRLNSDQGMSSEPSNITATSPTTTTTRSDSVSANLMDTCDSIGNDGCIVWGYLLNTNSMKALSTHLRVSDTDAYAALKAFMVTPAIKHAVQALVANTEDNKHTWKPRTMMPSIRDDKASAGRYTGAQCRYNQAHCLQLALLYVGKSQDSSVYGRWSFPWQVQDRRVPL